MRPCWADCLLAAYPGKDNSYILSQSEPPNCNYPLLCCLSPWHEDICKTQILLEKHASYQATKSKCIRGSCIVRKNLSGTHTLKEISCGIQFDCIIGLILNCFVYVNPCFNTCYIVCVSLNFEIWNSVGGCFIRCLTLKWSKLSYVEGVKISRLLKGIIEINITFNYEHLQNRDIFKQRTPLKNGHL